MTGKEYMEQIRNVRREIRLLQEQILRDTVYASNVKAIRYDVDRVQTSPEGDRMADIISGIVGNEEKLYKKVKDLMKQEDDARKYLLQLREEQERVLVLHYFNDLKWDEQKTIPQILERVTEDEFPIVDKLVKDSINEVLDKIRAEIGRQQKWLLQAGYTAYNVDIALDAIKSVVAESEDKE